MMRRPDCSLNEPNLERSDVKLALVVLLSEPETELENEGRGTLKCLISINSSTMIEKHLSTTPKHDSLHFVLDRNSTTENVPDSVGTRSIR